MAEPAALDIYVDSLWNFHHSDNYKLRHLLERAKPRGLTYRVLQDCAPRARAPRAFVHVDLTELPTDYRTVDGQYTNCVNGQALSISRLLYSRVRLSRGAQWSGPVIVKTVLNFHGWPELRFSIHRTLSGKVRHRLTKLFAPNYESHRCPAYVVYPTLDAVPDEMWNDARLMVERFIPGHMEPPITKHRWDFFYDVEMHLRSRHDALLCPASAVIDIEPLGPVPESVAAVRRMLHLDYGAIDYFVADGEAFVVDANKTVGIPRAWIPRFAFVNRHLDQATDRLLSFAGIGGG